jgi:hypothetical protein
VGCKVTVNDCSNGGCPDAGFGTGGKSEKDGGSGGTKSAGGTSSTGGSGGSSGTSTGGSSGSGGSGGTKSTGGSSSSSGGTTTDSGPATCNPAEDKAGSCAQCIDSKCCAEWIDCTNDADCNGTVGSKPPEFSCIQGCLSAVDSGIMTLDDCASSCQHDSVSVSAATSALIACTRAMGDSGTAQNCTQECFNRDLP